MFQPHAIYHSPVEPPLPSPRTSGTVWHFTDPAGLLGIVSSGALWCSSVMTMNDTSEIEYGWGLIRREWEDAGKQNALPGTVALVEYALEQDQLMSDTLRRLFITCASEAEDTLTQWLSYANPAGYSIGLDLHAPWTFEHVEPPESSEFTWMLPVGWYDVVYDPAKQCEIIRELFDWLLTIEAAESLLPKTEYHDFDAVRDARSYVSNLLTTLMVLFKDPHFTSEREVRYVTHIITGDAPKYRVSGGRIRPYDHLRLDPIGTPLPIVEVISGPNAADGADLIAASVLKSHKYDKVPMRRSDVPRLRMG